MAALSFVSIILNSCLCTTSDFKHAYVLSALTPVTNTTFPVTGTMLNGLTTRPCMRKHVR
jgi:hypothetical protein